MVKKKSKTDKPESKPIQLHLPFEDVSYAKRYDKEGNIKFVEIYNQSTQRLKNLAVYLKQQENNGVISDCNKILEKLGETLKRELEIETELNSKDNVNNKGNNKNSNNKSNSKKQSGKKNTSKNPNKKKE